MAFLGNATPLHVKFALNGIRTKNIGIKLNIDAKVALPITVFLRKVTACAVRVKWY